MITKNVCVPTTPSYPETFTTFQPAHLKYLNTSNVRGSGKQQNHNQEITKLKTAGRTANNHDDLKLKFVARVIVMETLIILSTAALFH